LKPFLKKREQYLLEAHFDPSCKEWLRHARQDAGFPLGLGVGLGLGAGVLLILQSSLLAWTVDQVIFCGYGLPHVLSALLLMLALIGARALVLGASAHASGLAGIRVKEAMRGRLLGQVESSVPADLAAHSSGTLVNLVVDGVEEVDGYFSGYLPQLALAVCIPLAVLCFVFPLDWISGLILLGTAPFLPLFMALIGRRVERLNKDQWEIVTRLSRRFLDAIQGLYTLKMFDASAREARVVRQISEEYAANSLAVLRVAFLSALVLEFMATVSIAVLAVVIGFRLLWGSIDFQSGFFVLLLAPEFYLPLRSLGTHFHSRMSALAAGEKMLQLFRIQTRRWSGQGHGKKMERVSISFHQVSYAYEPGRPGVGPLSFQTPHSGLVCLTGVSGTGKTTVLRLLMGMLEPEGGSIWINGHSLADQNHTAWLEHIAYVPQRPHLFQCSVAQNIRMGNLYASAEEIQRAASLARIQEEILALPHGFDTLLGEDGLDLSGGQRQRLGLARAFVRDCPLVLLDEPGAGLDTATRNMIFASVVHLARTKLVIAATHDQDLLPWAVKAVDVSGKN